MPQPAHRREDRPPPGWTAGVVLDVLVPLLIAIAILAFAILVFVESSPNAAGL
jgi:hypothetical protein